MVVVVGGWGMIVVGIDWLLSSLSVDRSIAVALDYYSLYLLLLDVCSSPLVGVGFQSVGIFGIAITGVPGYGGRLRRSVGRRHKSCHGK